MACPNLLNVNPSTLHLVEPVNSKYKLENKLAWTKRDVKRTYSCNPEFLLFLREQKGWTQEELAQASGYSERLISKAESGKSIASETINNLATTYSTEEKPIYPEDLISDPLSLAKEYIRALYVHQKDTFQHIKHFLHEEVVFQMPGDPALIPFAGEHHGLNEVERVLEIFFSILEAPADHDHEPCYTFVAKGNDVMLQGDSWIHPIGRPMEKPVKVSHHMKFERGKLILLDDLYDTQKGIEELNKP